MYLASYISMYVYVYNMYACECVSCMCMCDNVVGFPSYTLTKHTYIPGNSASTIVATLFSSTPGAFNASTS